MTSNLQKILGKIWLLSNLRVNFWDKKAIFMFKFFLIFFWKIKNIRGLK